jgi:hypothetical protein
MPSPSQAGSLRYVRFVFLQVAFWSRKMAAHLNLGLLAASLQRAAIQAM